VVYVYAEDRKGEHPAKHLAGFTGILQVDGYSGFKGLLANRPPGEIRLAFCWAHCRRRFYELHRSTGSPLAEEALRRIGELYRIEAEVRGRPAEERRAVRQERSRPIVDALHAWLTAQLGRVSGRSTLAEAIRYALRHWTGLVLFLDDGRLELGQQHRRASHPADRLGAQERLVRRLGRRGAPLGGRGQLGGDREAQRGRALAWLTDVLERMVSGRTKAHELERLLPGPGRPSEPGLLRMPERRRIQTTLAVVRRKMPLFVALLPLGQAALQEAVPAEILEDTSRAAAAGGCRAGSSAR
jgi:hypothetical protein